MDTTCVTGHSCTLAVAGEVTDRRGEGQKSMVWRDRRPRATTMFYGKSKAVACVVQAKQLRQPPALPSIKNQEQESNGSTNTTTKLNEKHQPE